MSVVNGSAASTGRAACAAISAFRRASSAVHGGGSVVSVAAPAAPLAAADGHNGNDEGIRGVDGSRARPSPLQRLTPPRERAASTSRGTRRRQSTVQGRHAVDSATTRRSASAAMSCFIDSQIAWN